ncbi:molybdopterin-dependent oxidoreductase [Patescibacteria group bacterium]|nr:molybdopterin-dependent oxidoreductase [Patescibacteria group bacterium]
MVNQILPCGQHEVDHMIAMPPITPDYPVVLKKDWTLKIHGEVKNELTYSFAELVQLGTQEFVVDFHCVTRWSKLDQQFIGVDFQKILQKAQPLDSAKHVIFESYDNYTTNLVLAELNNAVCFLATEMGNKEINPKFGGPVRAVVPHLYGWKSAKFLSGIKFTRRDEPGFWECQGYHNHGDPWQEERYS